ncbi:unnamed protein product [Amaranthus hypochondriacus]
MEPIKWEGETTIDLKTVTPQQVWPLIEDFCALDKFLPGLDKCYHVEGTPGKPGLIRCCESSHYSGGDVQYAKERLVMIDPSQMCVSYEILENNLGLKSYVATMKLFPINGDDEKGGCKFVWSFVCDPVVGFTHQGFCDAIMVVAKGMATRLEGDHFPQ